MYARTTRRLRARVAVCAAATALFFLTAQSAVLAAPDAPAFEASLRTATPIKHVIIIVGENRSFDHLFATYVPRHRDEEIRNLLSEQIITATGAPGRNFAKAHQFQITSAPNGGKFFSSADLKDKALYGTLPPPDVGGVGTVIPLRRHSEHPRR
jgi:phospholipase C